MLCQISSVRYFINKVWGKIRSLNNSIRYATYCQIFWLCREKRVTHRTKQIAASQNDLVVAYNNTANWDPSRLFVDGFAFAEYKLRLVLIDRNYIGFGLIWSLWLIIEPINLTTWIFSKIPYLIHRSFSFHYHSLPYLSSLLANGSMA